MEDTDKEWVVYHERISRSELQRRLNEQERVCRTCLRPAEPLAMVNGLLFCQPCLKSYKELMTWMQGG